MEGGIVFLEGRDLRQRGLFLRQGDFFFLLEQKFTYKKQSFLEEMNRRNFFGGSGRRPERLIGLPFKTSREYFSDTIQVSFRFLIPYFLFFLVWVLVVWFN